MKHGKVMRDLRRWKLYLTALSLVLVSPVAPAESLGRLFFTPEQRAALDRQRLLNILAPRQEAGGRGGSLRLDGVVRRSGGTTTVWVNGRIRRDDDVTSAFRIMAPSREPDRVAFSVDNAPPATLRVGETLNRATQQTTDVLARGQVRSDAWRPLH